MKEKLDTLTYSGSGRVITYGYDANHGSLNSLKYSDIDPNNPFTLNYDSVGRLTSILNPVNQPVSTYTLFWVLSPGRDIFFIASCSEEICH
jgi:hypothetical protein